MFKEMEFGTYYEAIAWELRAALRRYCDKWIDILCKEEVERPLYLASIEQKRLTVVVLSCALLEHTINFYLATKCGAARFEKLQWTGLVRKWTETPKLFLPAYALPAGSRLAKELNELIARRHSIMHAKPRLSIDGDNRHVGNEPIIALDENAFIERCACMPLWLLDHLLSFDQPSVAAMSPVRICCGAVMQELNGAMHRFEYATKVPEDLVAEIMSRGHRRDRARLLAVLIGPVPARRRDGSIVVRRQGEVIEVLKPLNFFTSTDFLLDLSDPTLRLHCTNQEHEGTLSGNK